MSEDARRPVVLLQSSTSTPATILDLKSQLDKDSSIQWIECDSAQKCVDALKQAGRGIFLFSVDQKEQVGEVLRVMIGAQPLIDQKMIRALGYNRFQPDKIDDVLLQKGVSEILSRSVSSKALFLKIDRSLRVIESSYNQHAGPVMKKSSQSANTSSTTEKPRDTVIWIDAIDTEADFWLMTQKTNPRKQMGRWSIEVLGPAPSEGKWEASTDRKTWTWIPSKAEGFFSPKNAKWVFTGEQPEFMLSNLRWQFAGEKPSLEFHVEGQPAWLKFGLDPQAGEMVIAKNSPHAQNLVKPILESLELQVKFLKERGKATEYDEDIGPDDLPREWNINARNLETNIRILSAPSKETQAKFMDLIEQQMILEAGTSSVQAGEAVTILVETLNIHPPLVFKFGGKVESVEAADEGNILAAVELTEFQKEQFWQFRELFTSRQNSITGFLKAVKGV